MAIIFRQVLSPNYQVSWTYYTVNSSYVINTLNKMVGLD